MHRDLRHNLTVRENAFIWVLLATLALMASFAVVRTAQTQKKQNAAIVYICSTTSVLDRLVVSAAAQIDTAFADGEYARLLKNGIITKKNVKAARDTLRQYRASHERLKHDQACFLTKKLEPPATTPATTTTP